MVPYRNDNRKCVVSYRNCTVAYPIACVVVIALVIVIVSYRVVCSLIVIVIVIPYCLAYFMLSSSVMFYSPI